MQANPECVFYRNTYKLLTFLIFFFLHHILTFCEFSKYDWNLYKLHSSFIARMLTLGSKRVQA